MYSIFSHSFNDVAHHMCALPYHTMHLRQQLSSLIRDLVVDGSQRSTLREYLLCFHRTANTDGPGAVCILSSPENTCRS